jgi:hypothetical protein
MRKDGRKSKKEDYIEIVEGRTMDRKTLPVPPRQKFGSSNTMVGVAGRVQANWKMGDIGGARLRAPTFPAMGRHDYL